MWWPLLVVRRAGKAPERRLIQRQRAVELGERPQNHVDRLARAIGDGDLVSVEVQPFVVAQFGPHHVDEFRRTFGMRVEQGFGIARERGSRRFRQLFQGQHVNGRLTHGQVGHDRAARTPRGDHRAAAA